MQETLVVGIAASAGGLRPMIELLKHAMCNRTMSFVVVSHLSRYRETELPKILERVSGLSTLQVTEGLMIERCHLYTIAPDTYLTIKDGRFSVSPRPLGEPNNCADVFFESLANFAKHNALSVVLSGSAVGSDGTQGTIAIARQGGVTFAQDPKTADFPAMPEAAIASGHVRSVLTPEQIGTELSLLSWVAEAEGRNRVSI